jgi:XTP/dITP diphosphohydrolase
LVLATHNRHKVEELLAILRSTDGLEDLADDAVVSAADIGAPSPVEDGVSFEENALIKARAAAAATGIPAVADDSGLCVDLMGGAPGILSARWCGHHGDDQANLNLLLGQLGENLDPRQRGASFACAAALVTPDGTETTVRGEMRGVLITEPHGGGGFGYDPIFVPEEQPGTLTTSQMEAADKNAISHRGKAFRALAPAIAEVISAEPQESSA